MNQQTLIDKLEECKHYDKDNRYMAATDLCAEIMKTNVQLEEGMEKRICSAFISHLDDKSLDVQGNAVKCIQKIASRIREKNLIMIVEKMAERVVEGEKETRDIYSLAIRSIISEINEEYAIAMIKAVYTKLIKGMSQSDEVREECLDILSEIFKRFGSLLLKNQTLVNKDELMKVIPEQLQRDKLSLRKKATNCLGSFGVILTQKQLHVMCQLLIDRIKKSRSKADSFTLLQCFGQLARTVGNKIAHFLNEIYPLLCEHASKLSKEQSIDIDNEIAEACLSTFESLIKKCPKEVGQYIQQILELSATLMAYDPNYTYDENADANMEEDEEETAGWGSEFEDENMAQEEDDDTSWKVRRGAIKTIEAIIASRPEMLRTLYQKYAKSLVNRFKERDDNVKCNVLEAFQQLLKSTVISELHQSVELELTHQPSLQRQRSSTDALSDLVPIIVDTLTRQLKSKNLKVKVAVMKTIAQLAQTLHNKLEPYFPKMLPEFEKAMDETQGYDLILDTLVILRRLFRSSGSYKNYQDNYLRVEKMVQKSLHHEYSKVVSEGLRVAGSFVYVLRQQDSSTIAPAFTQVVQPLYQSIKDKLFKTDIDQEVKQCSIIAMANFVTVCHKQLNKQQISEIIQVYNDRLQNDLTRDATLKAIAKISLNQGSSDKQLIDLSNLNTLIPRLFDLLHKAQRTIHLNTLETFVAIVGRYPQQFQQQASSIMKEITPFITDADLQAAALALRLAKHTVTISPQAAELQQLISKATLMTKSPLIQGGSKNELLDFFSTASQVGAVKDQTITELLDFVSLSTQPAASAVARIAFNGQQRQKLQGEFIAKITGQNQTQQIKGALCLGEFGKLTDLSGEAQIIDKVSALFKVPNEDVRTAASICLGNISIGNPNFFLQRVFALVDKADSQEKYLFLNTIREIIIHNSKCLAAYLTKLLPLLIEHSKNEDEQIRNIVAESIGRLFIYYSSVMVGDIEKSFKSSNSLEKATIVKAFKYAGAKETEPIDLENCLEHLLKLVTDYDLNVKKNALESINAIVHNQPSVVKNDLERMLKVTVVETTIKPELITEVDLGPFKHKVDEGIPIRKAAYALLDTMVEKIPERSDLNQIYEVVIKGLEDTAEECMIICLHVIGRLVQWAPAIVVSNMDMLIESFDKQFSKNVKLIGNAQSSEKAQNIMRAILRVVEQLQRTQEVEGNQRFAEFFKSQVLENPAAKDMYDKISATASQAVLGEHF